MARAITLKGFDAYAKRLKEAPSKLLQEADEVAGVSALNIQKSAREKAPHNDGRLWASIHPDRIAQGHHEVTVAVDYGAYVEFGTRSRTQVPPELASYAAQFQGSTGKTFEAARTAIYEWCRKKGIPKEQWYLILRSVMTKGIHAQPFLFPSVDEEAPKFYNRLKKVLGDL